MLGGHGEAVDTTAYSWDCTGRLVVIAVDRTTLRAIAKPVVRSLASCAYGH